MTEAIVQGTPKGRFVINYISAADDPQKTVTIFIAALCVALASFYSVSVPCFRSSPQPLVRQLTTTSTLLFSLARWKRSAWSC